MTHGGTSLIPQLQEIIESPESSISAELVGALSGLLVRILDGGADPLALMIIRVLERSEDVVVIPALQVAAEQGTPDVRMAAQMAEERLTALLGKRALESIDPEAAASLLPRPDEPAVDERQPPIAPRRTLVESAIYDLRAD